MQTASEAHCSSDTVTCDWRVVVCEEGKNCTPSRTRSLGCLSSYALQICKCAVILPCEIEWKAGCGLQHDRSVCLPASI
jgi:hypothetical protein